MSVANTKTITVPVHASLSDDAPGWGTDGPLCWKCTGQRVVIVKKNTNKDNKKDSVACKVCQGRGFLQVSKKRRLAETKPGRITGRASAVRTTIDKTKSPRPKALHQDDCRWTTLMQQAETSQAPIEITLKHEESSSTVPCWIPRRGEELCCLTGQWRILQKYASHRWTTDDLLTAWVASKQLAWPVSSRHQDTVSYLDLGCGNASVLQMVSWAAARDGIVMNKIVGVEARSEAVALARRSCVFNMGNDGEKVQIHHGDFRTFSLSNTDDTFHLITGTPPYFRVEFVMSSVCTQLDSVVQEACIQQGGMPTAKQSAPARCEFRGGIEAYCQAAQRLLHVECGRFVVCENWKNHKRVLQAAASCQLRILQVWTVEGRRDKGNLFAVYVMRHCRKDEEETNWIQEKVVVRDEEGNWSKEYKETVLKDMMIPF